MCEDESINFDNKHAFPHTVIMSIDFTSLSLFPITTDTPHLFEQHENTCALTHSICPYRRILGDLVVLLHLPRERRHQRNHIIAAAERHIAASEGPASALDPCARRYTPLVAALVKLDGRHGNHLTEVDNRQDRVAGPHSKEVVTAVNVDRVALPMEIGSRLVKANSLLSSLNSMISTHPMSSIP